MKKKTTKKTNVTTLKEQQKKKEKRVIRNFVFAIILLLITAYGAVKSIIATDVMSFIIYYGIAIAGIIIIDFIKTAITLDIGKDRLD